MLKKPKIHFVLGPTCSGKSAIAIKMAQDFLSQSLKFKGAGFQKVNSQEADYAEANSQSLKTQVKYVDISKDKNAKIGIESDSQRAIQNDAQTTFQNRSQTNSQNNISSDFQTLNKDNLRAVIINCDSRQIYKQNHIGSCLVEGGYVKVSPDLKQAWNDTVKSFLSKNSRICEGFKLCAGFKNGVFFESEGVVHFLVDFLNLNENYNLLQFVQDFCFLYQFLAEIGCQNIIITGGTVLYAKAILEKYQLTVAKPNCEDQILAIEKMVDSLSKSEMQAQINRINPNHSLNNSEYNNPQRLKRHLIKNLSKDYFDFWQYNFEDGDFGQIVVLNPEFESIQHKIWKRIQFWLENGDIIKETLRIKQSFGRQKVIELGLSYLPCLDFLDQLQIQNEDQVVKFYKPENSDKNKYLDSLRDQIFKKNRDYFMYQKKFLQKTFPQSKN